MNRAVEIEIPRAPPPGEALERLEGVPGRVLLESAAQPGRRSILAADPLALVTGRGEEAALRGMGLPRALERMPADPFALLEALLPSGRGGRDEHPLGGGGAVPPAGAWIGFLGYELGGLLERLPPPPPDDVGLPDVWLGAFDWCLVWDRERRGAFLRGTPPVDDPRGDRLRERMEAVAARMTGEGRQEGGVLEMGPLASRAPGVPAAEPLGARPGGPLSSGSDAWTSLPKETYEAGVERIREYIRAGDLFQANLTHRISRRVSFDGPALYRRLRKASPAPYAAYLDLGGAEVASVSPESFLSLRGDVVETSPIKGTAARGASAETDRAAARALEASQKDRAENVMIVDLLRNDLSRVCRPGTIEVPRLARLETHRTVHHLASTVRGRLAGGAGVADLLRATFPGGSITGAPKIRAMEILRELEPVRRGVYTGALGIVTFGGDAELSVAIRTAVLRDGAAHYGTGGGITLASEPEAEWAESLAKARAFLEVTGG